jgi:L-seryl-tRNA(Ser) seleniumtransferase
MLDEMSSLLDHPTRNATSQIPLPDCLSDARYEKGESNDVCEKARGKKQRTGYENHRAVNDRGRRDLAPGHLGPDAPPYESALIGDEVRSKHCGGDNDAERWPDADPGPDVIEQDDLDHRHDEESDEQPRANAHEENVVRPTTNDCRLTAVHESCVVCRVSYYFARMELRDLPSVDALSAKVGNSTDLPRALVISVCQEAIDVARDAIQAGGGADAGTIATERLADIEAGRPRSVINATGVLLHTNLGRAPMHRAVSDVAAGIASTASNVEIDLRTGRRSSRSAYLRTLLPLVTGAEDGFAVNNNAGALLLSLASVAGSGGRVAVSRGELIEIGGSFRLPDLMAASGATLVEVGTTNRTRLSDYEAVAGSVEAILKVHPSNYRVEGFQEEASYADLAGLAQANNIPLIADVGSGLVDEDAPWLGDGYRGWLADEPGVSQTVASGADLVLFSGDKLFGGPQAGIVVGTFGAVERAAKHPIARAVRLDGSAIAAVAATLQMYADQQVLDIPFWAMASASVEDIDARVKAVLEGTSDARIIDGESLPGAGSVPGATIPTRLITLPGAADTTWTALARHDPPVIASRRDMSTLIDLRSVLPEDDDHVTSAIQAVLD